MTGPLAGIVVLLTADDGLAEEVRALGAAARVFAVTRQEPVAAEPPPGEFDWIVFTSARAVAYCPLPLEGGARIASVGPGTSRAIRDRGGEVALEPATHGAGPLARALVAAGGMAGARVLFPCSEGALPTLPDALAAAGAEVTRLAVYRTVPADGMPPGLVDGVDVAVFRAPSAVDAFVSLGGSLEGLATIAIGPTTAAALRERGAGPVTAPTADRDGLLAALRRKEYLA